MKRLVSDELWELVEPLLHRSLQVRKADRLTVGHERRADIHEAFLRLGGALVCFSSLPRRF
jgi:hypothetical protein